MGFNFGAMLGGAADQIVKDIDDRETEVKLRTRTILDRHVAETAANRKEYKTVLIFIGDKKILIMIIYNRWQKKQLEIIQQANINLHKRKKECKDQLAKIIDKHF